MGAEAPPSGETVPAVDDRRRFQTLWQEIWLARVAASLAAAVVILIIEAEVGLDWLTKDTAWAVTFTAMAFPSFAAKRGLIVLVLVASLLASVQLALFTSTYVAHCDFPDETLPFYYFPPAMAASVGLAEGLMERSWITMLTGLLGGLVAGALGLPAAIIVAHVHRQSFLPAMIVTAHLGIGLSLALGRYLRDMPKRGAATPPSHSKDAPAL